MKSQEEINDLVAQYIHNMDIVTIILLAIEGAHKALTHLQDNKMDLVRRDVTTIGYVLVALHKRLKQIEDEYDQTAN